MQRVPIEYLMTTNEENQVATTVQGSVAAGFEPLRETFIENFDRFGEVGASCAVFHHGHAVVNLWGGHRNAALTEPWTPETVTWVASTTKGMTAVCANLLI